MNYNEPTRRYFATAACAGRLSGAGVYRGAAGHRDQGTWVQFDLQAAAGTVREVRFLAFGCPHTIAVSAWVAEQAVGTPLIGRLLHGVLAISQQFAVPAEKLGRLLIVEDAWLAAVDSALKDRID